METFQLFAATLLVASLGAFVGKRLRIPAGAMIGSMFAVVIMNLIWNNAYMPDSARIVTRIAAGSLIGSRIQKKDVLALKKIIAPSIILVFGLIVLGVASGILVYSLSNLDLPTSLFASAPGGMSDMALISEELDADAPKVALLQLLRILTVLSLFPILLRFLCRHSRKNNKGQDKTDSEALIQSVASVPEPKKKLLNKTLVTLGVGAVGGTLGVLSGIPAGAMIGAMVSAACYGIFFQKAYIPAGVRTISQTTIGALIGSDMSMNDVLGLKELAIPGLILILGMILINMSIGFLIYRFTDLDLPTALFASVPGGVTEMVLIASEFDADIPKVALLQLLRLVSVIMFFPSLLKFLCTAL